jgi:hypothetical protein
MPIRHRPLLESDANRLVDSRRIDGRRPFKQLQFCSEHCYEAYRDDRRAGLIYGAALIFFDDEDEAVVGWDTAARANWKCPYDSVDIDIDQTRLSLQEALTEAQATESQNDEEYEEIAAYIRSIKARLDDLDTVDIVLTHQ